MNEEYSMSFTKMELEHLYQGLRVLAMNFDFMRGSVFCVTDHRTGQPVSELDLEAEIRELAQRIEGLKEYIELKERGEH